MCDVTEHLPAGRPIRSCQRSSSTAHCCAVARIDGGGPYRSSLTKQALVRGVHRSQREGLLFSLVLVASAGGHRCVKRVERVKRVVLSQRSIGEIEQDEVSQAHKSLKTARQAALHALYIYLHDAKTCKTGQSPAGRCRPVICIPVSAQPPGTPRSIGGALLLTEQELRCEIDPSIALDTDPKFVCTCAQAAGQGRAALSESGAILAILSADFGNFFLLTGAQACSQVQERRDATGYSAYDVTGQGGGVCKPPAGTSCGGGGGRRRTAWRDSRTFC